MLEAIDNMNFTANVLVNQSFQPVGGGAIL